MKRAIVSRLLFAGLLCTPALGQAPPTPPSPPAPTPAPKPSPSPAPTPTPAPAPAPAPAPKPMPSANVAIPTGVIYAGTLVTLDGSKSVGDRLDWEPVSPADFSAYQVDSGGKTLYFASDQPGTFVFRLEVLSLIDGNIVGSKQRVSVTTVARNPAPNPIPPIPPNPSPPAPPVEDPLPRGFIATLVTDSAKLTAPLADVRDSLTLANSPIQAALSSLGGRGTTLDVNAVEEYTRRGLGPYLSAPSDATGSPVAPPALVIQDSKGKVLRRLAAPADSTKLLAYLKSQTAGN